MVLDEIHYPEESETLVREYYTGCVRAEWYRLVKDVYRRLEFETTLHFLEKYLPANGLLLDAGGGPGRYTLGLAKRGYDVVLVDLTPANLEFARRRIQKARVKSRVKEVVEGSILDLSRFADSTFDASCAPAGRSLTSWMPAIGKKQFPSWCGWQNPGRLFLFPSWAG